MFPLRYRRPSVQPAASPLYYDDEALKYDAKQKTSTALRSKWHLVVNGEFMSLAVMTVIAMYLRLWMVHFPNVIISHEMELCKHINWYLKGKFFIGGYPPLAGMIYASLARLAGYDGSEEILYGGQEMSAFPLHFLRMVTACIGALLVPMGYMLVRRLGHRKPAAFAMAALLVLENGQITQSRYVMPGALYCLFSCGSMLSWVIKLKTQEREPFETSYFWQFATGFLIGCALSVKWHTYILLPIVWTSTIMYIWKILGEKRFTMNAITRYFLTHVVSIGIFPLFVYFVIFQLHFRLVPRAGDHDLLVSPNLRYSLHGNRFMKTQQDVAYGSKIILRHTGTSGGYLHSHLERYTTGSTQHQVTVYPFLDLNSVWVIHKADTLWNESQPLEFVKKDDIVRLEHFPTRRKLHSHDHRPPVSSAKEHNEVTAYGDHLVEDAYDHWWIRAANDDGKDKDDSDPYIKAITMPIQLFHSRGCGLLSHDVRLPGERDASQQEVTCMLSAKKSLSTWVIEFARHEQVNDTQMVGYEAPSVFEKFREVHRLMTTFPISVPDRMAATPSTDLEYILEWITRMQANPVSWFVSKNAYRLWDQLIGRAIHFVVHPVPRVLGVLCLAFWLGYATLTALAKKRQMKSPNLFVLHESYGVYDTVAMRDLYIRSLVFLSLSSVAQVIGLYAIPTFALKLPDISPATWTSIALCVVTIEALTARLRRGLQWAVFFILVLVAAVCFVHLMPMTYGIKAWTKQDCESFGYGMNCKRFPAGAQDEGASRLSTVYVELPGKVRPFHYKSGEEAAADENIGTLQAASYKKAAATISGAPRYQRLQSTPGPTRMEVATWQQESESAALRRVEEARQKEEIEKMKAAESAAEKNEVEEAVETETIMKEIVVEESG